MIPCLHVVPDPIALAAAAATHWAARARGAIAARGRFTVALAGGGTPRNLYRRLASDYPDPLWENVWIYFSDERCVPPEHPDSNYGMAHAALLAHVPIPPGQALRMACEDGPETGARRYHEHLAALQPAADRGPPVLDLILLGLGTDGHTASLFPGSAALAETTRWAAPVADTPGRRRITLTFPVLDAAREIMFLVSGSAKAQVVQQVLGAPTRSALPAARLRPAGKVHWFLDAEAAQRLTDAP